MCCFERNVLSLQMNCFEAIETYLHKNIYPYHLSTYITGDFESQLSRVL